MVKWQKPEAIHYAETWGARMKIGFWLIGKQGGPLTATWPVSGDLFSFYFFINTASTKRVFFCGWGNTPRTPRKLFARRRRID